ncbi:MAG TPA: hypothetical protein VGH84_05445, partial [Steroidobacteraceae bacterium]
KTSGLDEVLAVTKMGQRPFGGADFGTEHAFSGGPSGNQAQFTSLALGAGGSIHVAETEHSLLLSNNAMGYAYNSNGAIAGTWTNTLADDGNAGVNDVGSTPSIGVLTDGTPVIAYYDTTNKSLRFAISTVPDGGNNTGATWTTYRIDTSRFGSQVGLNPALGVLAHSGHPDKILVAYGVADGTTQVLRLIQFDAPTH